jgi:lysophospholipase L1-like esterase
MRQAICLGVLLVTGRFAGAQENCTGRVQSLEKQVAEQRYALRDWGGLTRYGSDDSEVPPPAADEDRVVVLGDQITEFWTRTEPSFSGTRWLNRGIAGQTTDQMLVRFRQDVIGLHPKAVVISGGLNDIAGVHGGATEEMILDNFTSMTEIAQANGIRVVLASVTPVCECFKRNSARQRWQERINEVNDLLRKYAASSGAVYLDYYSAMADGENLKMNLTNDGVLPNAAGYAIMATLSEKAIAEALKK